MLEVIDFNQLRIFLALSMLGYASYTDVVKREISDFVWIIFGVIGVGLIFFDPNFPEVIVDIGIAMIVAPIAIIIWRFGLFGGADAFALIVLSLLAPQASLTANTTTPFTTMTNAIIISIIPLFVNFFRNLIQIANKNDIFEGFDESKKRRILAMFIGYKAKNPRFGFSIEKKAGKHKKLNLVMHHAEYAEFCNTPNTWVTPGIPYMLFIAAGFVFQLIYGDIIFNFLGLMN